jgi:hypothetical protein
MDGLKPSSETFVNDCALTISLIRFMAMTRLSKASSVVFHSIAMKEASNNPHR